MNLVLTAAGTGGQRNQIQFHSGTNS